MERGVSRNGMGDGPIFPPFSFLPSPLWPAGRVQHQCNLFFGVGCGDVRLQGWS